MKKTVLFLGILFVCCLVTQAQEDIFKKHGVTKEPLTLSKGKYKETFYNEEIMQVGTVLINTRTNKVVKFLEEDTTKLAYRAETTSRFLTVDPLAEKYYSWSPYVYCANNPIKYIDPDGRKIVIPKGENGFQVKAFGDMQRLTSSQLILLKSGEVSFADSYKGNQKNIMSMGIPQSGSSLLSYDKPYGTELVNDAIGSKNTITIELVSSAENAEFKPSSIKNGETEGVGSGGKLLYNPNEKVRGMKNVDGTFGGTPSFITLGHELIHGNKSQKGKLLDNIQGVKHDPDSPDNFPGKIAAEEVDTRNSENKLRRENYVKERATP